MKPVTSRAALAWPTWPEPPLTPSIEAIPLEPRATLWKTTASDHESKGGIFVLRRRYLRSEQEVHVTFRALALEWETETLLIASPTEAASRDSYQKIIGLGLQCVPLLLERLRRTRRNYFWALGAITHENPAGDVDTVGDAIDAWISWGRDNGYIDS